MNTITSQRISCLVSLAAIAVLTGGLQAQADTLPADIVSVDITETTEAVFPAEDDAAVEMPLDQAEAPSDPADLSALSAAEVTTEPAQAYISDVSPDLSAADLMAEPAAITSLPDLDGALMAQQQVAQVTPGVGTRSGSSYIGIAGNVGLANSDTPLGRGGFAFVSKIGLTDRFSVRPAVVLEDDVAIMVPVTIDFPFETLGNVELGPFVGGGIAFTTGDSDFVGLLLTSGVDIPFSDTFTGIIHTHVAIFDEASVGILLGVGYNFGTALFN